VIHYSLCDITVSCESSVFMWMHMKSLVTVASCNSNNNFNLRTYVT